MVRAREEATLDLNLYQFQLACTILRYVGQIFGKYLAHTMCNLPPLNRATQGCPFRAVIEGAGVKLESGIFGSHIDWFEDLSRGGSPQVKFIPLLYWLLVLELTFDEARGTFPCQLK